MAFIFYGALPPTGATVTGYGNAAVAGDVFISRMGTNVQRRFNGATWDVMEPSETRGDVLPRFGEENEILVRANTNDPFATIWGESATGMVWSEHFNNQQQWICNHQLRWRLVSVQAVKDDGTVMVPRVTFFDNAACALDFEEPVSGTAIIRR